MGGFEPIEGQALGDMGTGPCPHENYAKVAVSIGLGDVVYSCIKTIPPVLAPHWDHTHGDIGVYDARGKNLKSLDGTTGEMTKPARPGRSVDL